MKSLPFVLLALVSSLVTGTTSASCVPQYREDYMYKRNVGNILGNGTLLSGASGALYIGLTVASPLASPLMIPLGAAALSGLVIAEVSSKVHEHTVERAMQTLDGAYLPSEMFNKFSKRVNRKLKHHKLSPYETEELAKIVVEMDREENFCPIIKANNNGSTKRLFFSLNQMANLVVFKIMRDLYSKETASLDVNDESENM